MGKNNISVVLKNIKEMLIIFGGKCKRCGAKMKQASRLVAKNPSVITNENINMLTVDDFDLRSNETITSVNNQKMIGFY